MKNWFQDFLGSLAPEKLPLLSILGILVLFAYSGARAIKRLELPSILAYLLSGVLLGPSVLGVLSDGLLDSMDFVIQGCLAFIAFKIGLEIDLKEVRRKGKGLAITTLTESFMAVIVVCLGVWALSGELAMGLAMGALAPASAPAGTIAVIEEYGARGKLTETLYAVVGIDDGLGILIFGMVTPFAVLLVGGEGMAGSNTALLFLHSLEEILFSIVFGICFAWGFILVNKKRMDHFRVVLLTFGFILLLSGIAQLTGASLILANMIFGTLVGHWGSGRLQGSEEKDLGVILPFFFLLFFTIAGANLHISELGKTGILALGYIFLRSLGLYGGAMIGSTFGGFPRKVRENLGLGLLSQAGVAIGLALMVQQKLSGLGPMVEDGMTLGDRVGNVVFTTITASSIVFEFVGPLFARFGLKRAGEIKKTGSDGNGGKE